MIEDRRSTYRAMSQFLRFSLAKGASVFFLLLYLTISVTAQEELVGIDSAEHSSVERIRSTDSIGNRLQLARNLREIIGRTEARRGHISAAVYSLDQNKLLFDYRSGDALTPASTTKLFFSYAAMKILGAEYGVPTTIVTDGSVRSDSVLMGNVYLVGHGDCLLTPNDIESLAEQLRRSGIKYVQGDVIGDASYFDPLTERQAYSGDAERMQDMPPISALGINKNLVTVLVSSNNSGGTHVQTVPQSTALQVISSAGGVRGAVISDSKQSSTLPVASGIAVQTRVVKKPLESKRTSSTLSKRNGNDVKNTGNVKRLRSVRTSKSTKSQKIRSGRRGQRPVKSHSKKHRRRAVLSPVDSSATTVALFPAYGSGNAYGDMRIAVVRGKRGRGVRRARVNVSSSMSANGIQVFSVRGSVPRNTTRSFTYEIGRPALATAGVLVRSLQAEGIRVSGTVREGRAPSVAKVIAEVRRPLTELLQPVNKNSDNFVAEHVMKIVGAHCCGNTMCSVNAFKTVTSILDSAGIPHSGCVLYDGSGLSRRNKTSASTQMLMLKSIAEQPFSAAFINTMAIAGVDGTLRRRMIGSNAVNNVHAKTGTHSSVSALSGYVRSRDGERFCFSIIGNGLPAGVLKQMENACVIQLAEFSSREGTVSLSKPRR